MGLSLGAGALILGAVGTGISVYSGIQAANSQAAIAEHNAALQERQAEMRLISLQTQAALAEREAEQNFALAQAEAQARISNAEQIEQHALQQDALNRENIRRTRSNFARFQAEQRANIAASGIVESSGTPLDILSETAAQIQQEQEDELFRGELARRTMFREADMERLGGQLALAGATLNRDSQVAGAGLQLAAGRMQFRQDQRAAEITRLAGQSDARASRIGAFGSFFSGASNLASTGSDLNYRGAYNLS